ncbi:MAG: HpcH/HpaI aldolase/citrate lyase family protein [Lachnospiraceae bacterium]|nr:HpcH/HpaI aldolase/citrate lyase family protein [Lachnospiraceae bacterium]
MRHHGYNPNFNFVVEPEDFNKYSDKELLQYCLGATIYMPGTKNFLQKILDNEIQGLTSMVFCFEDACPEDQVDQAEQNVLHILEQLSTALDHGELSYDNLPLIFCRVRNQEQFEHFASQLTKHQVKVLAGINFPKFNTHNGRKYMEYLEQLNRKFDEILYAMPIIEDAEVAWKETRQQELAGIRAILECYKDIVLQVRVGATDFSSYFGVRRGVDYSIYDVLTVREILSDIINVFGRNNDYVLSGPVWEYFRVSKEMMFETLPDYDIEDCLLKRIPIVNTEVDGLLREVILDKANGFVGKTVIHPTHIKYVNAMQAVTKEEYQDAVNILNNEKGGVFKGESGNKMNEVKPHTNWAMKIYMRSRAYGVIEDEKSYIKLFEERGSLG